MRKIGICLMANGYKPRSPKASSVFIIGKQMLSALRAQREGPKQRVYSMVFSLSTARILESHRAWR
jgi:hypothetical protein